LSGLRPIKDPCSPDSSGQGIFDRKEVCHFQIRSLTPQRLDWLVEIKLRGMGSLLRFNVWRDFE